jgi:hypothetical protein
VRGEGEKGEEKERDREKENDMEKEKDREKGKDGEKEKDREKEKKKESDHVQSICLCLCFDVYGISKYIDVYLNSSNFDLSEFHP